MGRTEMPDQTAQVPLIRVALSDGGVVLLLLIAALPILVGTPFLLSGGTPLAFAAASIVAGLPLALIAWWWAFRTRNILSSGMPVAGVIARRIDTLDLVVFRFTYSNHCCPN